MEKILAAVGLFASLALPCRAEELFRVQFARGAWDPAAWLAVKSARFDYVGEMRQEDDHVTNQVIDGVDDETLLARHLDDVYACLLLKRPFTGDLRIAATMSFDHRMAPLLLLSGPVGADRQGRPEHREHYEFVLFDEGVNVWHHTRENGGPAFHLEACLRRPFAAKTRYELTVDIATVRQGKFISVQVGGENFGFSVDTLPEEIQVGFAGCEGRNRFYDFTVSTLTR